MNCRGGTIPLLWRGMYQCRYFFNSPTTCSGGHASPPLPVAVFQQPSIDTAQILPIILSCDIAWSSASVFGKTFGFQYVGGVAYHIGIATNHYLRTLSNQRCVGLFL